MVNQRALCARLVIIVRQCPLPMYCHAIGVPYRNVLQTSLRARHRCAKHAQSTLMLVKQERLPVSHVLQICMLTRSVRRLARPTSSGSMVGLIIGPIVAGVIGLLFWKIQRSKEWALYREEHPLAHVLYEQMKLKYANFKSAEGIQYMTMIYALEKQMKACGFKYGNVDEFNALTPKQRQEVAIHIETSFRSYQQGPKAVDTGCWTKLVSSYNKSLNLDMLLQDSSLIQAICKQTINLVGVVSIRSSIELNETELRVVVNPLEDATASE
jgi:hypothetical protein